METPFDLQPYQRELADAITAGDTITIAPGRPPWWKLWKWPRYWRELRKPPMYRVTSVSASTIHLDESTFAPVVSPCPMCGVESRECRYGVPCYRCVRPAAPVGEDALWYRGWEAGWEEPADYWTGQGYRAYKGGCDLDAPEVTSSTWSGLLDEIDEAEND